MFTCTRSELEARAISSVMIAAASHPMLLPPYSSGITVPNRPSSPIGFTTSSYVKQCFASHSSANGAILPAAKPRTISRNITNSSDNPKSIVSPLIVDCCLISRDPLLLGFLPGDDGLDFIHRSPSLDRLLHRFLDFEDDLQLLQGRREGIGGNTDNAILIRNDDVTGLDRHPANIHRHVVADDPDVRRLIDSRRTGTIQRHTHRPITGDIPPVSYTHL